MALVLVELECLHILVRSRHPLPSVRGDDQDSKEVMAAALLR